ncbi:3-methylfumaryl-CoA hydratase [Marinobacter daqiaonensis]|uniref:3-methylfumaryl-CoA hydratase n=1 Tax=Marinobacter daqiaonensis TaxID=650891 RepID=A0A1I6IMX8_9GAMM|nr:3-methylfumaryl-CoA hydratase [Marinobacter daqiaonensis]
MVLSEVHAGIVLPERTFRPDEVQLFMYNAAIWNSHRIHYDQPYTTGEEGHPGIVIDGPLQGDFLTQLVLEWVGEDAALTGFEYSNRKAAYIGDTLVARGQVTEVRETDREVEVELAILNESGDVITPGKARMRFHQ